MVRLPHYRINIGRHFDAAVVKLHHLVQSRKAPVVHKMPAECHIVQIGRTEFSGVGRVSGNIQASLVADAHHRTIEADIVERVVGKLWVGVAVKAVALLGEENDLPLFFIRRRATCPVRFR